MSPAVLLLSLHPLQHIAIGRRHHALYQRSPNESAVSQKEGRWDQGLEMLQNVQVWKWPELLVPGAAWAPGPQMSPESKGLERNDQCLIKSQEAYGWEAQTNGLFRRAGRRDSSKVRFAPKSQLQENLLVCLALLGKSAGCLSF